MGKLRIALPVIWVTVSAAQSNTLGPAVFTAPGAFPTSLYRFYYNDPTATTAQPQPIITDPVTVRSLCFHSQNSN